MNTLVGAAKVRSFEPKHVPQGNSDDNFGGTILSKMNSVPDPQVWKAFEDAIFRWSKAAREEVTRDWKTDEERKLHARAKDLALASPANSPEKKSPEFRPESPLAA